MNDPADAGRPDAPDPVGPDPAASDSASRRPHRTASSGALTLMVGTLASRVSGLVRTSLLNQLFSQTITDAFTVALKVPNLFRELLAEGALTNSFVPVYRGLAPDEGRRLSGALLGLLVLINALLTLLFTLAAPLVVRLLLGAEGSVDAGLALRLTRVVFPFLAAISLSAWAMGILNAEERFFAPAWAPVALNLVTIGLMLAYPDRAVPLALAFVLGALAQFAFQIPFLVRAGLWPRLGAGADALWHPELAGVLLLMVPFAFTTSARQFLNVVATRLLDTLPGGSQTAFFNADLFLSLALGLFSISPALAYYSRLSANAAEEPERFRATLLEGLRLIGFLSAPAGLVLALIPEAAVQSVLNWVTAFRPEGGANPLTLALSSLALGPLGLAVFPLGLNNLLVRTFYVRRRVRTPVVVTVLGVGFTALLYVVLAPRLGIEGLSWATVISAWLQLALLLALVRRNEGLDLAAFGHHAVRVWAAAALALGGAALGVRFAPLPGGWLGFALEAAVGTLALGGLYAAFGAALGLPELAALARRLRR